VVKFLNINYFLLVVQRRILVELFVYPNQPQKAEKIQAVNTRINQFYYVKVEFCSLKNGTKSFLYYVTLFYSSSDVNFHFMTPYF
jgi:hypothetical protein